MWPLTLLTTRSSCTPFLTWASQMQYFGGFSPTSQADLSGFHGGDRCQSQKAHSFSYHCYADLSLQTNDSTVSPCISTCLSDTSAWMKELHLQINLAKLLVIPANPSIDHNIIVQLQSTTLTPTRTAKNLSVVSDDFFTHISTTPKSCGSALDNIGKIRLFLLEYRTQLLV